MGLGGLGAQSCSGVEGFTGPNASLELQIEFVGPEVSRALQSLKESR